MMTLLNGKNVPNRQPVLGKTNIYSLLEAPFQFDNEPVTVRDAELLPLVAVQWAGVAGCIGHPHWRAPKHSDAPKVEGDS